MTSPAYIKTSKAWRVFPHLATQEELEARVSTGFARHHARVPMPPVGAARTDRNVRQTVLSITNIHEHGELFVNYLKMRREIFIRTKHWALSEADGMEFDQYDTPQSRWVVLHEYGEILAGVRIAPTTARCGLHSYMIRDAQLGLLPDMPQDLLYFDAPVGEKTWEGTRLFLSPEIPSWRRPRIHQMLLKALGDAGAGVGARQVIAILPVMLRRWMNRVGMTATAVGREMEVTGDRVQCALIDVGLLQTAGVPAPTTPKLSRVA